MQRQHGTRIAAAAFCLCGIASSQTASLGFIHQRRSMVDAHNCYPYEGRWADRVERALKLPSPIGIEQDLAWYVDPATKLGRVVVSHTPKTNGAEPEERQYFFERVRPLMEKELKDGDQSRWPLIVLHFDFKDNQPALLHALWSLLGEYEDWIVTAPKSDDIHKLSTFTRKPILVLTEDSDAQEAVFYGEVPIGGKLRLFGSAHTAPAKDKMAATLPPEQLLLTPATDYRRWWNNSWNEVEEGGQPKAGEWTDSDNARLQALVERAHALGYWIRFYTLDGFDRDTGKENGWFAGYNFGSKDEVRKRWEAAIKAGVDLIASDQYEELANLVSAGQP